MNGLTFSKIQELGPDLMLEGKSLWEVRVSEFLEKVRELLWVTVMWWNHWSKHHRKCSYRCFKQEDSGQVSKNNDYKIFSRVEFGSLDEFLQGRDIDTNTERIPTREDIEKLSGSEISWFIPWRDYIFDDGGWKMGVFQIYWEWEVAIGDIYQASYVWIRTIKIMTPYSSEQIARLKKLKDYDWIPEAKKEKIRVTSQYIEIDGIRLKLEDEEGKISFADQHEWDHEKEALISPKAPSREQWQQIIDFIWGTKQQVYMFFREVLGMKHEDYQTSTGNSFEQEYLMICSFSKELSFNAGLNEWPEWEAYARFMFS